jgi:predicted RNase H-like HicB family nuclease
MHRQLAAIIEREADGYVASCPELDIASQGSTVEEARRNLQETLELFFDAASADEIRQRLRDEVYVTPLTVPVPDHPEIRIVTLASIVRQSGVPRSEFEA